MEEPLYSILKTNLIGRPIFGCTSVSFSKKYLWSLLGSVVFFLDGLTNCLSSEREALTTKNRKRILHRSILPERGGGEEKGGKNAKKKHIWS